MARLYQLDAFCPKLATPAEAGISGTPHQSMLASMPKSFKTEMTFGALHSHSGGQMKGAWQLLTGLLVIG
jgi:hypothetical protein